MIVKNYKNGIIHLIFPTQDAVTRAMVRLQEFYESPHPNIRGQFFTHDTFEAIYGPLEETYYKEWNGFNIPGHVVAQFFVEFGLERCTPAEREIFAATVGGPFNKFYLIATWSDDELRHEIAHALYYLDDEYRARAEKLVEVIPLMLLSDIVQLLVRWGYHNDMLLDEIIAYLSEASEEWWSTDDGSGALTPEDAAAAWRVGSPFRALLTAKIEEMDA